MRGLCHVHDAVIFRDTCANRTRRLGKAADFQLPERAESTAVDLADTRATYLFRTGVGNYIKLKEGIKRD